MTYLGLFVGACLAVIWLLRTGRWRVTRRTGHRIATYCVAYLIFSPFMARGIAIGNGRYVWWFMGGLALWLTINMLCGAMERDAEGRLLDEWRREEP